MDKQDWYDMGAQIGDLVQSAIDSRDFKQLNQSITDTINTTMNMVQKNVQDGIKQAQNAAEPGTTYRKGGKSAYEDAADRANRVRSWETSGGERAGRPHSWELHQERDKTRAQAREMREEMRQERNNARGYGAGQASKASRTVVAERNRARAAAACKGITFMAVGYTFAAIFGIAFVALLTLRAFWGAFGVAAMLFLVLALGFLYMGLKGGSMNNRVKRLRQYLKIMGDRDTCTLEELAAGTGKSKKYVLKDLREMIQYQMFNTEAYLDAENTCLMTSQRAYQQYRDAMEQFEQRRAREEEEKREQERIAKAQKQSAKAQNQSENARQTELPAEVRQILQEGREFIAHIHKCNDDIPDEKMSEKLSRLEAVVGKIFDQVAKKPQSAPDLHKMMSYYLPITKKLVDAYRDLDDQPVEGQNISRTKQEIEDSLDTINTAFENLLDSFFQDTAWDISSDITVLHTMMAQDGLMKKDFATGERIKTVASDVTGGADK